MGVDECLATRLSQKFLSRGNTGLGTNGGAQRFRAESLPFEGCVLSASLICELVKVTPPYL